MKICVDAREFTEKGKTGIARYLENLLPGLASDPDIEIVLLSHDARFLPPVLQTPRFKHLPLPNSATILVDQIAIPRLVQREKADVFFSPYYKMPFSGAFKKIITVHDIMFLRLPTFPALAKLFSGIQLRLATKRADLILADSQFSRNDLSRLLPRVAGKIRVLYPSLEAQWLAQPDSHAVTNARERFADGKPFLLYVGNFTPHKNVDLIAQAFTKLAIEMRTGNRRLLLVGGDDRNAPRIESLMAAAGQDCPIRLHRHVDDHDLRALYAGAEWFITASEYEGFGYPLLEAMSSGCPVISHPCTSIPEVVGESAVTIKAPNAADIAESMLKAMSMSAAERGKLVAQGRTKAATFCSTASSKTLADIMKSLVIRQARR